MSTGTGGAAAIVSELAAAGTSVMYGVPGGGPNLDVVGAAAAAGVPFVLTHSESAAVTTGTFAPGDPRLIFGLYKPGG
jgi:acetolactate synthase I/II/III large subunit